MPPGRPAPEMRMSPIADADTVTPSAAENADVINALLAELRRTGYLRSS